jgi:tryptophan synthase alpha chain
MSRLSEVFKRRKALVAYVTVGYPTIEATLEVVPLLEKCGCDVIELGIPFSDPIADGATIQEASQVALENGVTSTTCFEISRELSRKTSLPLLFMGYLNPLLRYGLAEFSHECARSGIGGLIIPDLPPEEGTEFEAITAKDGIDLVYMLAPTSTTERIHLVGQRSRGFIYLTSVAGVTGARNALSQDLPGYIARVRQETRTPLCVGFGISSPQQAAQAAGMADGVIIGSHLLQLMQADRSWKELAGFISATRSALDALPGE